MKTKFFTVDQEGRIESCIYKAKTYQEAHDQNQLRTEIIISISEKDLRFIEGQFRKNTKRNIVNKI